jgi:glycosyltransferase involved in cell wall biosynthesis
MRIALDARLLGIPLHGIARYTCNLIQNLPLKAEDHLLVLYHPQAWLPSPIPQVSWVPWLRRPFSLWADIELWALLKRQKIDLFHSPSFICPRFLPCPWVLTLHDLIHVQRPQDYGLGQKLYFDWLKKHLKKAAGILTVSETSAQALKTWLGETQPPIQVTYPGIESSFKPQEESFARLKKYSLSSHNPYYLFVGNNKAHKNFELLRQFWQKNPQFGKLVSIGLSEHKDEGQIIHLTKVPEADLRILYAGARALISPSLNEGFGLPPLEALACGTPVAVSDIAVYREVLGEAADYFDPHNLDAPNSLEKALLASQARIRPAAMPNQNSYAWSDMAQATYQFYQQACHAT